MKQINKIISIAVLLVLIAFAAYYINKNISDFKELALTDPILIAPIVIILLAGLYLTGFLNKELLKPFGVHLQRGEEFALAVITRFYNFITPFKGGMAARAIYLKKRHEFAYVHFLATLSAVYVLVFLIASTTGIVSTFLIYFQTKIFSWVLFLIFLVVLVGMLFIIFLSPKFPERKNKWLNRFILIINGWHLIKGNKRVISITLIIIIAQVLLGSLMLYLQFRVFGLEISFISCLFLNAIASLSLLISITPGNLGIQEAIVVFSALTIGITPAESLSAALLGRAVSLVVLFILGPVFSYTLMRRKNEKKH